MLAALRKGYSWAVGRRTLLAGLDFNFSKIFCDWVFVAKAMMKT